MFVQIGTFLYFEFWYNLFYNKVSTEKKNNESDSDSSSLPSLEDEQNDAVETKKDNKKKKTTKKVEGTREQKGSITFFKQILKKSCICYVFI